jgi:hypothetical protein
MDMTREEIEYEVNHLSIDDLHELADFCEALADALEQEQK